MLVQEFFSALLVQSDAETPGDGNPVPATSIALSGLNAAAIRAAQELSVATFK
jgi:hypothetical protein